MFDFDAGKLLIIGVVALIVIGPKDLPRVLRQVGQAIGKMRRMATDFQGQFMDAMKEADFQEIRDEVNKINRDVQLDVNFDPARDIQSELTRAVTPSEPIGVAATSGSLDGFTLPSPAADQALLADADAPAGVSPTPGDVPREAPGPKRKLQARKRSIPSRSARLDAPAGTVVTRYPAVRLRRREASAP